MNTVNIKLNNTINIQGMFIEKSKNGHFDHTTLVFLDQHGNRVDLNLEKHEYEYDYSNRLCLLETQSSEYSIEREELIRAYPGDIANISAQYA